MDFLRPAATFERVVSPEAAPIGAPDTAPEIKVLAAGPWARSYRQTKPNIKFEKRVNFGASSR
jgi:hypothetical protein